MAELLDKLEHDGLTITVSTTEEAATVLWEGTSDARDPATLIGPFLGNLVRRLAGKKVSIDFRRFKYMNSSTVTVIMRFVKQLDAHQAETMLRYDTDVEWQRVSFNCMKTIARSLGHVRVRDR